jgi:hypothetical protein
MRVVEEFSSTVRSDWEGWGCHGHDRVDEMPVPMMRIDHNVFSEVPERIFNPVVPPDASVQNNTTVTLQSNTNFKLMFLDIGQPARMSYGTYAIFNQA